MMPFLLFRHWISVLAGPPPNREDQRTDKLATSPSPLSSSVKKDIASKQRRQRNTTPPIRETTNFPTRKEIDLVSPRMSRERQRQRQFGSQTPIVCHGCRRMYIRLPRKRSKSDMDNDDLFRDKLTSEDVRAPGPFEVQQSHYQMTDLAVVLVSRKSKKYVKLLVC